MWMVKNVLVIGILMLFNGSNAIAQSRTPSNQEAEVYIISPTDGQRVTSPVTIKFGLRGIGVAPAGTEKDNTGHHHLIVDAALPPLDEPIPSDENYRHFGGGQTEVTLELGPGNHTLQLLLADHNHIPHDPVIKSSRVIITVK